YPLNTGNQNSEINALCVSGEAILKWVYGSDRDKFINQCHSKLEIPRFLADHKMNPEARKLMEDGLADMLGQRGVNTKQVPLYVLLQAIRAYLPCACNYITKVHENKQTEGEREKVKKVKKVDRTHLLCRNNVNTSPISWTPSPSGFSDYLARVEVSFLCRESTEEIIQLMPYPAAP
ncbi:hypothetical protein FRC03_011090, partial [Tulasnella sp. 419]